MAFERKWPHRGALDDEELAEALSLVLQDSEINRLLNELFGNTKKVRLGEAERDRDLEDRLGFRVYQVIHSTFSKAVLSDGYEISRHLDAELARRLAQGSS
jgi:hypothetical protein